MKRLNVRIILFLTLVSAGQKAFAQIGAEAQGGRLTTWFALGLDQEISKRLTSVTDFGFGRHSDPTNLTLFEKQGLWVFTQDFIYRLNEHWRIAASFGYWRRNYYSDSPPYEPMRGLEYRNEVRPFQRIYYDQKIGNMRLTHTVRMDYRFYWLPEFNERWATPFEFRARYMMNLKLPITHDRVNQIIINDEILTAVDKMNSVDATLTQQKWSAFKLTENRCSIYYRRQLSHFHADLDLGLMHQYWREVKASDFTTSFNVMVDLIVYNPFGRKKVESSEE